MEAYLRLFPWVPAALPVWRGEGVLPAVGRMSRYWSTWLQEDRGRLERTLQLAGVCLAVAFSICSLSARFGSPASRGLGRYRTAGLPLVHYKLDVMETLSTPPTLRAATGNLSKKVSCLGGAPQQRDCGDTSP